ncbi:MAG TPA: hypothetical protein VGP07_21800 [Polyangia bacterium]|jgi:hypothetical protein
MSIDAIGNIATIGVGATAASTSSPDFSTDTTVQAVSQPPPSDPQQLAQQDATVTTLSDEALAQQAADEQAARDAAAAASASTVTSVVASDWSAGTPTVDNAAVQEALDALDQASRDNLQADAVKAQQTQADLDQKTVDDAAAAASQQQDAIVLAAINAGIRLAFGAVSSPITGDPALREPGQVEIVA